MLRSDFFTANFNSTKRRLMLLISFVLRLFLILQSKEINLPSLRILSMLSSLSIFMGFVISLICSSPKFVLSFKNLFMAASSTFSPFLTIYLKFIRFFSHVKFYLNKRNTDCLIFFSLTGVILSFIFVKTLEINPLISYILKRFINFVFYFC